MTRVWIIAALLLVICTACAQQPKGVDLEVEGNQVVLLDTEGDELDSWNKEKFVEILIAKEALPPGRGSKWIDESTISVDWGQIKAKFGLPRCSGVWIEDLFRPNTCHLASAFDAYYD